MLAYDINKHSAHARINRLAETPYEALLWNADVAAYQRLTRRALSFYGVDDESIDAMVKSGFLRPVEISSSEAISITLKHKFRTDSVYRAAIQVAIKKSRETYVNPAISRTNIKRAQEAFGNKFRSRRRMLMNRILVPKFGYKEGCDVRVSIMDVVEAVEQSERLRNLYPDGVYHSVMLDLSALGVPVYAASHRLRTTWQRKLAQDPELREVLKARALNATAARKLIYEQDPSRAEQGYRSSAESRRRKMAEDPTFRATTLSNLGLGNSALWEKYRTDPDFREQMKKKQRKNLLRGIRTIKRRAERRRQALDRIVNKVFGDLSSVNARELADYLGEHRRQFAQTYFRDGITYCTIKKDLTYLRANSNA